MTFLRRLVGLVRIGDWLALALATSAFARLCRQAGCKVGDGALSADRSFSRRIVATADVRIRIKMRQSPQGWLCPGRCLLQELWHSFASTLADGWFHPKLPLSACWSEACQTALLPKRARSHFSAPREAGQKLRPEKQPACASVRVVETNSLCRRGKHHLQARPNMAVTLLRQKQLAAWSPVSP